MTYHLPSCQKMSANKENNLVQAYIELNKFCQNGDYERALKAAGKGIFIKTSIFHSETLKNLSHLESRIVCDYTVEYS